MTKLRYNLEITKWSQFLNWLISLGDLQLIIAFAEKYWSNKFVNEIVQYLEHRDGQWIFDEPIHCKKLTFSNWIGIVSKCN